MSYYDESQFDDDPWARFDPEVAASLREVFDYEIGAKLKPMHDEAADRKLAAEEQRMRSIYGEAYDKNRVAILTHAVERGLPKLEDAFHAWRGSQDPANAEQMSEARPPAEKRDAEDRVLDPQYAEWDRAQRKIRAQDDGRDDMDAAMLKMVKEANGRDDKAEVIAELGDMQARRKSERDARKAAGLAPNNSSRVSKEEKYADMDARAIALLRGDQVAEPYEPSRREREADNFGHDASDQILRDVMSAQNAEK